MECKMAMHDDWQATDLPTKQCVSPYVLGNFVPHNQADEEKENQDDTSSNDSLFVHPR